MSNEHNNGPAVPQGEPVAAWLKAKIEKHALLAADCPGSSSVVLKSALLRFLDRLPPVAATPATQAQDVPSGEVVAWMVYGNYTRQPFGMLSSAEAYMRGLRKSDPDGGYHIRPLTYTTPAPAPAQERCSTCGYLTSEREHLGCLRRAVKDLDIATGGPYDAQGVGLTDEEIEAIAKKHMSTVGDHWCNEEAIREIHAEDFARAIIAALLAKWGQS